MKVQSVTIQNFKNIEELHEDLNGANVLLIAENGLGKSTFMQAIQIALGNTHNLPPDPITFDKNNAFIEVVAGDDDQEYKFEAKYDRRTNRPVLSVTMPDGGREIRKGAIGNIVGSIDFDIMEFVNLSKSKAGKKQQIEIIKSFFNEEIQEFFRQQENRIEAAYHDRTEENRNIKTYKALLSESSLTLADFKTYAKKKNITKLEEKLAGIDAAVVGRKGVEERIEERENKIEQLQKEIKELEVKNEQAYDWLEENPPVDADKLRSQVESAREFNVMAAKVASMQDVKIKLEQAEEQSGELTALIDSGKQAIEDAIKDIDMPISGLSFDQENLLYNNVPVDVDQMATSEIIHLGIELKMARHPNVHVLCIEHGESLGTDRLRLIQELCEKYDYQIIMEQVERGREELTIEIMPKI